MASCAVGISVHTGWAAAVVASGSLGAPRILGRETLDVLGDADRFVYHMAEKLPLARAERLVENARSKANEHANAEMKRIVALAKEHDHQLVICAIVAKTKPMPGTLAEIVAAHPRIHTAEGCGETVPTPDADHFPNRCCDREVDGEGAGNGDEGGPSLVQGSAAGCTCGVGCAGASGLTFR